MIKQTSHPARRSAHHLLALLALSIFVAEAVIMFVLQQIEIQSAVLESVIDGALLTLALFPALYFFVFRKLVQQNKELKTTEDSLRAERGNLEERVEQRTKEIEEGLARFADIAEVAGDWIWEMDSDVRFVFLSERFFELFPIDPEDIIGKTRDEFSGGNVDDGAWREHLDDLANRREFRNFQYEVKSANGPARHILISGKPIFDEHGVFKGYRGTGTDKTAEVMAQEASDRSENQFRNLIEGSIQGVFVHKDWDILFTNEALAKILGYSCQMEILDQARVEPLIASHEHERLWSYVTARKKGEFAPEMYEAEGQKKDGSSVWLEFRVTQVDWNGVDAIQCVVVDITERKKAEALNLRLANIVEESVNEIFVFDAETLKFEQVNTSACKNLGYTIEELRELTPLDLKPHYAPEAFESLVAPLRNGERDHIRFETIHQRKDGSHYDADITLQQIRGQDRPVFAAIIEDVTEHNIIQNALHESDELFTKAFHASPAACAITNPKDGTPYDVNEAWVQLLGHTREEATRHTALELGIWADPNRRTSFVDLIETSGSVRSFEAKFRTKDGAELDLLISAEKVEVGGAPRLFVVCQDITEQKKAEQALELQNQQLREQDTRLKEQNQRFDAALSNMSQSLCMFDAEQRLIVCNDRYASMYGLSLDQVKPGTTLRQILECRVANDIYAGETPEEYSEKVLNWVRREGYAKKIQKLNDGRSFEITHHPMPGGGWLATHEDITERKKTQEALQQQQDNLYQILRNVPRAVITADSTGIIQTFNPEAEETFGYAADEAIGQNVTILMPEQLASHHDNFMQLYRKNGRKNFVCEGPRRLTGRRKDGAEFPIELALAALGHRGEHGFVGVAKDITDQIAAETQLVEHRDHLQDLVNIATQDLKGKAEELQVSLDKEKRLNQLQREFVSMASHEFRTPLAIIDMTAQRLKRLADSATPDDVVKRSEKIRHAVVRMTRLMESTLTAARMDDGKVKVEIEPCDIAKVVREVCERQQDVDEKHIISCDLTNLPETIQADTGALEQALTNLLSNAVKYAPDAPDIEVKACTDGHEVVISVRDHGIGIDPEELSRIGERFFRAKTSTGIAGTGIGLNLVRALVEMHDGFMNVESKKGEGSTFTVRLPIAGPPELELEQGSPTAA